MDDSFNTLCLNGDIEQIIKCYDEYPSDIFKADGLYWACYASQLGVVHYFKQRNFDFTTPTSDGKSIISAAAYSTYADAYLMVDELLSYGLDINTIDENGQTPLMFAIMKGNLYTIVHLVDKGANLDYIDPNGIDMLTLANGFENRDKVIPLLQELKIEKEKSQLEKTLNLDLKNGNKIKI